MKYSGHFAKEFLTAPFTTWRRTLARLEIRTGKSTLWLSPSRALIRLFERLYLTKLPAEQCIQVGNYYIHRDISYTKDSIIYSAGVGTNIEFDLAFHDLFQCPIHMIDPTPNSKVFLQAQNLSHDFIHHEFALSNHDGEISFYPDYQKNDLQRSSSFSIFNRSGSRNNLTVLSLTLQSLMAKNNHDHIDLLKMDIEGAASYVLINALKGGITPGQVICELEIPANPVKCIQEMHRIRKLIRMLRVRGYKAYSITDALLGTRIEIIAVK